jgi:oligoribonuclease
VNIYCDLETTGLNPHKDSILEIAMVATDDDHVPVGEPFVSLVKPLHLRGWEAMDPTVREMHEKSGLLDKLYVFPPSWSAPVLRPDLPRLGDVERAAIDWLARIWLRDVPRTSDREPMIKWSRGIPLAGNSVHFDKRFLAEHMDELEALFSHRILDVSSFTIEMKRACPEAYATRPGLGPDGKPVKAHRALDDVMQSIATMRHYRPHLR